MTDDSPLPMVSEMDEMVSWHFLALDNQNIYSLFGNCHWYKYFQMSPELKEIEMEDIEEAAPDIDSGDAGNSLAVADYVDEIYRFYRKTEVRLWPSEPSRVIFNYPAAGICNLTTTFCVHRVQAASLQIICQAKLI